MIEQSRRSFIASVSAFAAAVGLEKSAIANAPANPFRAEDYVAMRKELGAFYPAGFCRGECQSKEQVASAKVIEQGVRKWMAEHVGADALDARRECYLLMRKHFVPFLFGESPFYFEAGVNGGWSGARPGLWFSKSGVCGGFFHDHGLVPDEAFDLRMARESETLALCCGAFVDEMHHLPAYRTILEKGFRGVRDDVAKALADCPADDVVGRKNLETALVGFDTIHEIQLKFSAAATKKIAEGGLDERAIARMRRIEEAAKRCPWEPPRTFFEGLNTLWFVREILGYVDGLMNCSVGHPDAELIGLYRKDLAAGRITEDEARDLVARFLVIADCHDAEREPVDDYVDGDPDLPMTLGGCDREGNPVWNELTEMFLDAHIGCDCLHPKLHCRIASNSPESYLRRIGAMLMKGHPVFTLFNDDRFIQQFTADGIPLEDARSYIGSGCWDGLVDGVMEADTCNYVSLVKLLEMTIHRNPAKEKALRVFLKPIDRAQSFEEVRGIVVENTLRFLRDVCCEYTRWGRQSAKVSPHPVHSCCLRGGLTSRRDYNDGGVPPNGRPRIITLGFIGNVVDSLLAIKRLCFEDRICTLPQFLDVVRSNWKGEHGEECHKAVLSAPYWGDDTAESNEMMAEMIRAISDGMAGMRTDQGGEYRFGIYTYREFLYWGRKTKATPDGRRDGDQLVQGFSPSELRCDAGMTTVLNAVGTLPHEILYQSNLNQTFDADVMSEATLAAVMRVFAQKGAHLLQPNCNSVDDLIDAQRHPERHRALMVRVCGFSARFVNLSRRWQDEIIARNRLR